MGHGFGAMAVSLMANEVRWVLEDCRPDRKLHGEIRTTGGFKVIRPLAVAWSSFSGRLFLLAAFMLKVPFSHVYRTGQAS